MVQHERDWQYYAKLKKLNIKGYIWFHLYEISIRDKSINTESRLVWGQGLGREREMGTDCLMCMILGAMEIFWNFISVVVEQCCECTKCQWIKPF